MQDDEGKITKVWSPLARLWFVYQGEYLIAIIPGSLEHGNDE